MPHVINSFLIPACRPAGCPACSFPHYYWIALCLVLLCRQGEADVGHEDTLLVTEICLIWKEIAMGFEYFHPFPLPQEVLVCMDSWSQSEQEQRWWI